MPVQGDDLRFEYLPNYAQFLLDHELEAFSAVSLKITRELKIPILEYFSHLSEEALFALFIQGSRALLEHLARNQGAEFIDMGLKTWTQNQLPRIQSHEIVIEDITMGNFARRKLFRSFLHRYVTQVDQIVPIMEEVDRFTTRTQELSLKTLFDVKQRKINEHHHFIDKINNASPGVLYVFDLLEQKEIYTNYKREELLGYSEEEMKSMGSNVVAEILHPDDLQNAFEHIQNFATIADGEIRTNEYRVRHKLGHYRWHRAYETVFKRTPEGIPAQIIGIAIDVSNEKEAIDRLEHNEQLLREAQEIAGMGSFEWNMEGQPSTFSSQLFKIFELEGNGDLVSFLEHVHPSDRKKVKEAVENALQGDGVYESEYRYHKNQQEKVIWSRGLVTFRDGKPVKMNGTVMDVTQRHHTLKRLERSEELHKQAQALTHIGNWSWLVSANEINWSDEMYRIYGLEPQSEKITFERFISLVHPDDRQNRQDEIQRALQTLRAEDYAMRIVAADGQEKVLQGKGEVLADENNKAYKLVGTCQDITQQFRLNEQLAKKNIELERSNRELMAFNYIASHDLQEPIRKIKIFSNRLLEKSKDILPAPLRDFVDRIVFSADYMQQLIEALLAFSRTTTTEQTFEPVHLNDLLEEVKISVKDLMEEKNAVMTMDPLPTVHVIPFQFRQLFENILSNALKYSRPDTACRVHIQTDIVTGDRVKAEGAVAATQYHHIAVSDNGIGFDQQYALKIFELFQRLHSKNQYSGTGVGLAICKKIMENHHGFISAESVVNEGTTFHIYLPVGH